MVTKTGRPKSVKFLCLLLIPLHHAYSELLAAEGAKISPEDRYPPASTTKNVAAEQRANVLSEKHLSLFINQDSRSRESLPSWCKPVPDRKAGHWHLLADDEYTNESPYLLCGLPEGAQKQGGMQRTSMRRRTAHVKGHLPALGVLFLRLLA